ncbi:MAG TPA: ribosome small subunit-dependent GTPase A [Pirellulales bacterium]|jgi:ribosome biogenesis GTPase|nr:ribosome small subunit-dependent GTPase A [Pirellulales bacterium]
MAKRQNKIRTEFRKNRTPKARAKEVARGYLRGEEHQDAQQRDERVSGKGELTRKRTVVGEAADVERGGLGVLPDIDKTQCLFGRVLSVFGLTSAVQADDGRVFHCSTRRILKTLSTDQRHVVAAGDRVWFLPGGDDEGVIERIEPRTHLLCRTSKRRQHILVTNVDQLLIVGSAAEPYLKPNLIDRFLLCAEQGRMRPLIIINKVDLIEPADLMPLSGVYARMGYAVHLVSAATGAGIAALRRALQGHASAVVGQSGVGKSSLLNAIDPQLRLKVGAISEENQKGKHTTTTARLSPLAPGGYVVDTPGIRQFQLWDTIPAEVIGFFRDLRPYVNLCRFPNCSHTHEAECAIKNAVADGRLDARRYESYCQLAAGVLE